MKRILSVLLILTLLVVCSNVFGAGLEERVLKEQVLNSVVHDPEQIQFGDNLAGIITREKFHIGWPVSHGKRRWVYEFWYNSETEDEGFLMDQFRNQMLNALQQSGAVILDQEGIESSDFPPGFRIEYEKVKVSGEVSVIYKAGPLGFHAFEVTQSEVQ